MLVVKGRTSLGAEESGMGRIIRKDQRLCSQDTQGLDRAGFQDDIT